jgi:hypothetical protein
MTRLSSNRRWSPEEDARLRDLYGTRRLADLLEHFPGRSLAALLNRGVDLGLKGWSMVGNGFAARPGSSPAPAVLTPEAPRKMADLSRHSDLDLGYAADFLRGDGYGVEPIQDPVNPANGCYRLVVPGGVATLIVGKAELIERAKLREAAICKQGLHVRERRRA